jgi:hypothetical protein
MRLRGAALTVAPLLFSANTLQTKRDDTGEHWTAQTSWDLKTLSRTNNYNIDDGIPSTALACWHPYQKLVYIHKGISFSDGKSSKCVHDGQPILEFPNLQSVFYVAAGNSRIGFPGRWGRSS